MPWRLEQRGSDLNVDIRTPVDDWEAVLDGIHDELQPGKHSVTVRSEIPGSSSTDAALVHLLCQTLADEGIVVRFGPSSRE